MVSKRKAHRITPSVGLFEDQLGAAGPKPPAAFLTTLSCHLASNLSNQRCTLASLNLSLHRVLLLEGDIIVVYNRRHFEEAHEYLSPAGPSEAVEGH